MSIMRSIVYSIDFCESSFIISVLKALKRKPVPFVSVASIHTSTFGTIPASDQHEKIRLLPLEH